MSAGELTHRLLHPVELRGKDGEVLEVVRELTLHRLNGGAARRVLNAQPKGPGEFAYELVCASARIPPSTFERLDAEDVMALVDAAAPFLGSGPATR